MFRLEPDLLVEHEARRWVLDTKWERLDATVRAGKYGIDQADLYQLFAYGMKYLGPNGGDLALVFPRCDRFQASLPVFEYGHGLRLRVMPFDLGAEALIDADCIGLPLAHRATTRSSQAGFMQQMAPPTVTARQASHENPYRCN